MCIIYSSQSTTSSKSTTSTKSTQSITSHTGEIAYAFSILTRGAFAKNSQSNRFEEKVVDVKFTTPFIVYKK